MSISDVLRPDGSDYNSFLYAEVGEDGTGRAVTVLSALARLDLEPWTEARELAFLSRDAAQIRMKAHLAAISDIPALALASGSVATNLVSLLPMHASHGVSRSPEAINNRGPRPSLFWLLSALIGGLLLAWIYFLGHTG